jgi:hypothetical protein
MVKRHIYTLKDTVFKELGLFKDTKKKPRRRRNIIGVNKMSD